MTSLALPAQTELLAHVRSLCTRLGIEAVIASTMHDSATLTDLVHLHRPLYVLDRHDTRVATHKRLGSSAVYVTGEPARCMADLRARLPRRSLLLLGACPNLPRRDEIFWLPRGEGAIAAQLYPGFSYPQLQDQLLRWSPDHRVEYVCGEDGTAWLIATPRPRVHVTFLIERYTHEYGTSGLSINLDNLVATLAATGLATANVVHYDQCYHEGRPIPLPAISKPVDADVHVLACTCHYHSPANPAPQLLRQAKASGSQVVFFWLDKKISQSTPEYYAIADLNVVLDGNDFELPNAWPAFTPKNPAFFCDPGLRRERDVCLVGEVRYLAQRKAYVERFERETRVRIDIVKSSAADQRRALSVAEYARVYQTSKIALALTKDSVRQLKGRVFEVLHCGALLMCDVNHHVSTHLEPGRDYVVWRDYDDLITKCRHYLAHEGERDTIAQRGHQRAKAFFSHDVFWRSLLARLGGSAAHTLPRADHDPRPSAPHLPV